MKNTKMLDFMDRMQEKFPNVPRKTISKIIHRGFNGISNAVTEEFREVEIKSGILDLYFLIYNEKRRPTDPDTGFAIRRLKKRKSRRGYARNSQ